MAGTVIIPWYATGLRSDAFAEALTELARTATRYGATSFAVYRARDDLYKFQQLATFEEYEGWERYWEGTEMIAFRTRYSSWYQIPVLYGWWDQLIEGSIESNGYVTSAVDYGPGRTAEGESA